jgi:hypothetical protein
LFKLCSVFIAQETTELLPPQIRALDADLLEKVKEFREHPSAKSYLSDPKYNDFFIAR